MHVTITKGAGASDRVTVVRGPADSFTAQVAKKGPLPHDAVHWVVERALGIADGFWGAVAGGMTFEEVGDLARAGGHPSSKRASVPTPAVAGLVVAERVVECFEAELWSAPSAAELFRDVLRAACAHSRVPAPALSDADIGRVRSELETLLARWRALPAGADLELD